MSNEPKARTHVQTAEDKKPEHYAADWWVYVVIALFIGGLVFLTYALTLRGDVMSEFGKPGTKTAPPSSSAGAPPAPAQPAAPK